MTTRARSAEQRAPSPRRAPEVAIAFDDCSSICVPAVPGAGNRSDQPSQRGRVLECVFGVQLAMLLLSSGQYCVKHLELIPSRGSFADTLERARLVRCHFHRCSRKRRTAAKFGDARCRACYRASSSTICASAGALHRSALGGKRAGRWLSGELVCALSSPSAVEIDPRELEKPAARMLHWH